jgi:predicted  nucleic acid-binding Zn-ribbon protein
VKADPSAQLQLLDVQELDSRADQLRHRLATLPELAELEELRRRRAELDGAVRDQQVVVDDLGAEQAKIDKDVESVRARRERDRRRMDEGLVSNPKDLERMTHEMGSLERRITSLEDEEIEVMERLEEAQTRLATLREELEEVMTAGRARVASREEKSAALREELDAVQRERAGSTGGVPADLLALYDRLREAKGGVGAALLKARQCGGCRLTLDHAEITAIKGRSADDVVRCEECQRILVRTAESGL